MLILLCIFQCFVTKTYLYLSFNILNFLTSNLAFGLPMTLDLTCDCSEFHFYIQVSWYHNIKKGFVLIFIIVAKAWPSPYPRTRWSPIINNLTDSLYSLLVRYQLSIYSESSLRACYWVLQQSIVLPLAKLLCRPCPPQLQLQGQPSLLTLSTLDLLPVKHLI